MDSSSVAVNQVNVSVVPVQQQQNEQSLGGMQQQAPVKLTPEQEEELKLRSKYPNPQKPGGSAFIQKMLHKGCKKYFDSGDYNMAKSKHKQALGGNRQIPGTANPMNQQQQQNVVEMTPSTEVPQGPDTAETTLDSTTAVTQQHDSSHSMVSQDSHTAASMTPTATVTAAAPVVTLTNYPSNSNINPAAANATHPVVITPMPNVSVVNTSPSSLSNASTMSPSVSVSAFHSHSHLNPHATGSAPHHPQHPQLSSSLSTSSVHMLATSISTDRLSNVQLNPTLLDDDEIGHAIPTPECLPQSRKHSIVQSKLATPTLSST